MVSLEIKGDRSLIYVESENGWRNVAVARPRVEGQPVVDAASGPWARGERKRHAASAHRGYANHGRRQLADHPAGGCAPQAQMAAVKVGTQLPAEGRQ
jgi:hypothetical protein